MLAGRQPQLLTLCLIATIHSLVHFLLKQSIEREHHPLR